MQKSTLSVSMAGEPGREIEPSILGALPYFLPIAIFPLLYGAATYGGWWLVGPFAFLWLTDQLDVISGEDPLNMAPDEKNNRQLFWYSLAVWAWSGLYLVIFVYTFWQIFAADHLALWEDALVVLALGVMARMALNAGHDMMHRTTALERRVGEILMASMSFAQEVTEHIYTHHAYIGTPKDSLTPPKGQSFWKFLPRSIARSYLDAWRYERKRMARRKLPTWHYTNPIWRYALEIAAWYGLAYWIGGVWGILVLVFVCALGILQLRMADYIQHYGLQRIRLPNGRYERVHTRHSWTAAYKLSNWLYYNAQRHADHHITAARPYPVLQHCRADASPQLPGSYGTMGSLIMSPRRWFAKMDPLVDEWRARFYPEIDNWDIYDSAAYWARPDEFDVIAEILDTAPPLAAHINHRPELLDSIRSREFTELDLPEGFKVDEEFDTIARRGLARVYWTHELDSAEMLSRIAEIPVQGIKETVEIARNWSNDKVFQVCMHTLRGNLTPAEAGTAFANIAEASVVSVLSAVDQDFLGRSGESGVAAVMLGDLASGDAAPGAKLDVMFVCEHESVEDYEAQCHHFHTALHDLSQDNLLLGPLPRDRETPAVCSLGDLQERHRAADAPAAELLNLVRARHILTCGSRGTGERFDEVRRDLLTRSAARDALIAKLRETPSCTDHPEWLAVDGIQGGRQDVERAARFLQLTHAAGASEVLAPDAVSVFRAAGTCGIIASDVAGRLAEAATMWRNLRGIMRLVAKDGVSADTAPPPAKPVIARACGADDVDALTDRVDSIANRAVSDITALIGH